MEAENLAYSPNWVVQSSVTGFTGSGYLVWTGPQYTSVPGNGLITTTIFINTPGVYQFQFRSAVGRGDLKSEHNDAWVRFPDADDFFAEKDGIKLYPRGSGKSPTVSGAGSGGWFKAFASNLNWSFTTQTNDGNGYPIFVQFDKPGEYTMELSARSSYHLIDRIILHQNASSPRDLNKLETTCSIQPPIINVSGITVTPSNSNLLVGNSQQIAASVSPANATNKTVIWSSSNPAIATVSSNGLVSAVSEGTTNITARTQDGNFTGTSTITVSPNTSIIGVTGISVNPSTALVLVGSSQQIFATVVPTNATNKSINWTSSNSSVASVNSTGLVTGISVGSALITARTQDGDFSASTSITVNPNTSSISIESFTLVNAGTNDDVIILENSSILNLEQLQNLSLNFRVNTLPSLIGSVFISLTGPITASRTENGAPYSLFGDSNGNYSGRNLPAGTYTLSAIPYSGSNRSGTEGPTTTIVFSIIESVVVPVSGISTSPTATSVNVGDSQQITATIIPSNASNKNVIWSSSNPLVATVNSTGLVTGLSVGDAIITARSEDGDFTSSSSVSVLDTHSDLNLVGYWKLEENSGNILIDHSGNGNNATVGNTSGMSWVSGQEGLALRLSGGSNSFGTVPHNPSLDFNNEITIAAWIKPSSLAKKAIISKGSPDGFFLMNQTNGKIEFRFNGTTNGTTYRLQSNQNYPTNG
ncbi:Ig-like domain-containing protein, partial [Aquiflexum gelatinilyticum]